MVTIKKVLYAVLITLCSSVVIACSEKDDFIPEPTPTSVIISGKVTTSSGQPLANIPVYIDYDKSYWLGSQTTIHKAKATTDSDGRYRLFFEPEKKSDHESGAFENYFLYVDLKSLSSKEFIMPGDYQENTPTIYKYRIYKEFAQGENLELNLHFPKKKNVTAECRNFLADESIEIRNEIPYGVDYVYLGRNIDLDSGGNGMGNIPCAIGEVNKLSVISTYNIPEEIESREIVFEGKDDTAIVFDNDNVLKNRSFKLALYDYFSYDGTSYEHKGSTSVPAPFDCLGFRILLPDGQYEAFGTERYQYYDSILCSSPQFPETFKVYEKKWNGSTLSEHLVTQWSTHLFDSGFYKIVLSGYKNGRVICSDSVTVELKDRDFLCFEWSNLKTTDKQDGLQTIYCQFNSFFEYRMSNPVEKDGIISVDIYVKFRDRWSDDILLNWQETRLNQLLLTHLGKRVDYDKTDITSMFRLLSSRDLPGKLYENETTRAIIMHRLPDDDNMLEKECFYIHVETK